MTERDDGRQRSQTERLLAAIVSSSDDAIISKTIDGLITSWNTSAERIFGYSAAEMIGQPVSRLAAPGYEHEMPAILERIRRGERVEHFETARRHRDGSIIIVSLTVSPIFDDHGIVIGASKVARDITASKRVADSLALAEERLLAKNRELEHAARLADLGQMAATLAHEVNQPLSAILAYLQGVQRLLLQPPESAAALVNEGVASAILEVDRATEIVRRLKTFAKPGSGELALVRLDDVIRDAVSLASLDPRWADAGGMLSGSSDGAMVMIDRIEIQQVVLNLIRNALDALEGQSSRRVEVKVRRLKRSVEVAVVDNGPGVPTSLETRIFDAFVSTKPNGLGLGLSVCGDVLAKHDGTLGFRPLSPSGAEFSFRLPLHTGDAAPDLIVIRGGR